MLLAIVIIVIVVMGSVIGVLIYFQLNGSHGQNICYSCVGQPVSQALSQNLSGVSLSTLNQIGAGQGVTKLSAIPASSTNGSMTYNGKPEVLYIGGEFCPFCAAQRWSLIVALSKFGNFTNLQLMLSSSSDIWSSTNTFTFANSTYSSPYISFVSVERYGASNSIVLQNITTSEQAVWGQYDSSGSIPFLDVYNKYTNGQTGSQYEPWVLRVGQNSNDGSNAPYNWTQIASQLNNPNSLTAKSIDGAANNLISAICSAIKSSNETPPSICNQSLANQLALIPNLHSPDAGGQPIVSISWPTRFPKPTL